ncbi:MAG TPA: DUF2515 family protein [Minicystis sp.]|nr:DUF2515 family protein [Minicystis sp.]
MSERAGIPAELAGVVERMRRELDARNADNVARTESYLELYALTREGPADWPWLLMAHLVSRNAGCMMVDVALAIEHEKRFFTRGALHELFLMLERANHLIFYDAWHHVTAALLGRSVQDHARTPAFVRSAYAAYGAATGGGRATADTERRLVLALVTNEQNYIERRVVSAPRFARAMALVGFFEQTGHDAPLELPLSHAEIKVGRFASLERRIDAGARIFDEVLADRVRRAEIFAWALETPHTGSRVAYGGKATPRLRDVWPVARVRELDASVHDPAEPDAEWP